MKAAQVLASEVLAPLRDSGQELVPGFENPSPAYPYNLEEVSGLCGLIEPES